MTEEQLKKLAKEIAEKANECCNRSDGFEEAIYELALKHLTAVDFAARSDKISVSMSGLTDAKVSELAKMTAKQVYTQGINAGKAEGWNDAIEAAIVRAKESGAQPNIVLRIGRLKK